jgi:hypothetical protein
MTNLQRGWVAGIIEGEGCIRRVPGKAYFDSIRVANTDPEIISALLRFTGTGKVYELSNRKNGYKPSFMWYLGLKDSTRLARQIADCSPKCQKFLDGLSNHPSQRRGWPRPRQVIRI